MRVSFSGRHVRLPSALLAVFALASACGADEQAAAGTPASAEARPVGPVEVTKNGGPATGLAVETVSEDERTLVLRIDGDFCSSTRLDSLTESERAVRVALIKVANTQQPCPASIVFQRVTLRLDEPLADRRLDVVTSLAG